MICIKHDKSQCDICFPRDAAIDNANSTMTVSIPLFIDGFIGGIDYAISQG